MYPSAERLEAFAEGLAVGLSVRQAALKSGYAPSGHSYYGWLKKPEFMARVEKLRRARSPAATSDLEPVIERLLEAAEAAKSLGSADALKAACNLLTEAGRLKRLLPAPDDRPRRYEMPHEEWLATYPPKPAEAG